MHRTDYDEDIAAAQCHIRTAATAAERADARAVVEALLDEWTFLSPWQQDTVDDLCQRVCRWETQADLDADEDDEDDEDERVPWRLAA